MRSGNQERQAARTGGWAADPWPPPPDPPPAPPPAPVPPAAARRPAGSRTAARRAARAQARSGRVGMAGAVPYLAVLVAVAAGVYIAWYQGSRGGGAGGAVAGSALLAAAAARFALPARLAGLLASRKRMTDVLTLTVLGAGLLVAGLVLPRLGKREKQATCPKSRWPIPSSS
ncbi:MAG TPA: DUF3017 domain-containing protein [Trebonia sp.]|nr:DUF3017 domain-containing protein [Trebonia sp.]